MRKKRTFDVTVSAVPGVFIREAQPRLAAAWKSITQ